MPPKERTAQILTAALKLSAKHGYTAVTRDMIAEEVGASPALVSLRVGTMPNLRRSIVRQAIAKQELKVIGQAVAANDPLTKKIPEALRRKALASL